MCNRWQGTTCFVSGAAVPVMFWPFSRLRFAPRSGCVLVLVQTNMARNANDQPQIFASDSFSFHARRNTRPYWAYDSGAFSCLVAFSSVKKSSAGKARRAIQQMLGWAGMRGGEWNRKGSPRRVYNVWRGTLPSGVCAVNKITTYLLKVPRRQLCG